MANPFLFGKIVTGEHFCNREKEKHLLEENLKGGQSIVVISPRRMGKSSLLSVVTARLESLGMVCGCIDFFGLKSVSKIVSETVRVCAETISRQESDLKRFLATIADTFKRTRIAIEPSPDGSGFSVKPEITLPLEIRTSLAEAIAGLDDFLGKRGKKGVLVMDEFQEILSIDRHDSTSLEAEFRTVVQSTKNVSFAFLGSQASLLSEMFTGRKRPFFQAAKIIDLGSIDRKSLGIYIEERFKSAGISVGNPKSILDLVNGHPDYAQRLSSHIYDIITTVDSGATTIRLDDTVLKKGLKSMLEACSLIFIPEWQSYPLRQQQVLSILAEHGPLKRVPALYLAEYSMSATSFSTALKELLRKGVVKKNQDGQHELTDPFFGMWVMRRW
jgi:AAA+ ATPase superfamily predicted ATPase